MVEASVTDVSERFKAFLGSFTANGEFKYRLRLAQIPASGGSSLIVDFEDLMRVDRELAIDLLEKPDETIPYIEDAALSQFRVENPSELQYESIRVRLRGLPAKTPLRVLGAKHIGKLIAIDGILVRASSVQPFLMEAVFRCRSCDSKLGPYPQKGLSMVQPAICDECKRTGPFELLESESKFINSQNIRVQERPEDLPPGQLPRWIDVTLTEDLVDIARPGDRVTIVGIARTRRVFHPGRSTPRTFDLYLETNSLEVIGKEPEVVEVTPEEERQIRELASDVRVHEKIIQSIAPSIYGYEDIKESIMYLLFGGVPKTLPDKISIRGDANVLIIGDPGTAKSQLLQYVSKVAPRGLYTSGRGSTAAGLTAAVIREREGGMSLEAGALVLADRGICAIDEIDKMRAEDRVAIHEAMEQQTVSVAKGGIVATLNARASILAAANPALGRYDPYRSITENINLPTTILSRFDLIFVIKDEPITDVDKKMAEHILTLHKTRSAPSEPPIPLPLLRKYIAYAKQIDPVITDEAARRLQDFYLQMRTSESRESPIAITARQLESLVRLAEARARAACRREVTVEDAQAAILLMQKSLRQVGIDLTTGRIDIDIIMTGRPKSVRDRLQILLSMVVEGERKGEMVREEELYERAEKEYGLSRLETSRLLDQLSRDGMIYSPKPGYYKRT
ncbi:MAG: minichromosome maintenance protein MCM [Candidatus Bathyarchaeia archaeon]